MRTSFLEKMPLDQMAYLLAESSNSAALSKIRAYLHKWRPIRIGLPVVANELAGARNGARARSSTTSWSRCSRFN